MLRLTRQHWLALGGLGLAACLLWGILTVAALSLFSERPAQNVALADVSSAVASPTPARLFASTWTPPPTKPPATATLVNPYRSPTPSVQRDIVNRRLVTEFLPFASASPQTGIASPDRRHLVNVYRDSKGDFLVVDGKREKAYYEAIDCCQIVWSHDSRRVAFVAKKGNQVFVVADGKEGPRYDKVFGLTFSPDSKHVLYAGRVNEKSRIVIDGKEGKAYDRVTEPLPSPDSKRIAFVGISITKSGDKARVVVDGKEGPLYEGIIADSLRFSPDSRHVAYAASVRAEPMVYLGSPSYRPVAFQKAPQVKVLAVLDGREGKRYDNIFAGSLSFSPDSQRLVYSARSSSADFVVLDGKEGEPYYCIAAQSPPLFSPDSRHLAYAACDGAQWFIVSDGKEQKAYGNIGRGISYSPDSKRIVYTAFTSSGTFVVVDGMEGSLYSALAVRHPFSPDSKRLGYVADLGNSTFAVVDGNELGPYSIGYDGIVFSPDSRHFAYVAYNQSSERVIVDGKEGLVARIILGDTNDRIVFDSADSLHYLAALPAANPPGVYLIEEKIK